MYLTSIVIIQIKLTQYFSTINSFPKHQLQNLSVHFIQRYLGENFVFFDKYNGIFDKQSILINK